MPIIVLDTNVLISAIVFKTDIRTILKEIVSGKFSLAMSPHILSEVEQVLSGPKFRYPPHVINAIMVSLRSMAKIVDPQKSIRIITQDPVDNRILECALAAGADFIVSGDKHLRRLGRFKDIPILSPRDFIKGSR